MKKKEVFCVKFEGCEKQSKSPVLIDEIEDDTYTFELYEIDCPGENLKYQCIFGFADEMPVFETKEEALRYGLTFYLKLYQEHRDTLREIETLITKL